MRRDFLKLLLTAGVSTLPMVPAEARIRFKPVEAEDSALIKMRHSPFPYDGDNPESGEEFLNVSEGKRRGHASPAGITYWAETYSDRRSLLYIPKGFNLGKRAALVVYFHGNYATLERDVVDRQHIPLQLAQSGINAVLAAPQFALDARDSSPGNFWRPGYFAAWLAEAGAGLAKLHGDKARASDFDRLPVILIAYSGGYYPAAWCLKLGGASARIAGLVLLDALYGDAEKFAAWIAARHRSIFFFSAYTKASRKWNLKLQDMLTDAGIHFRLGFPDTLKRASLYFGATAEDTDHIEFMSQAWTTDPLRWTLERISEFRV